MTQGHLLKITPYRDFDAILTVYFREYGKLSLMARGVRKAQSKNSMHLLLYSYGEYDFILKKGLSILKRIRTIDPYDRLFQNLAAQAVASELAEYYLKAVPENHPDEKQADFLETMLKALDNGLNPGLADAYFLSFILAQEGITPDVEGCAVCHKKTDIVSFSIAAGGFLCREHSREEQLPSSCLRLIRALCHGAKKAVELVEHDEDLTMARRYLAQFYDDYGSVRLHSRRFIQN